jgi:hypothetical protein
VSLQEHKEALDKERKEKKKKKDKDKDKDKEKGMCAAGNGCMG